MSATEATTPHGQPIRLLLETETHRVPGQEYGDKLNSLRNTRCRRYFNRDYDHQQDRCYMKGDDFAFARRRCFTLIDNGSRDATDVPVLRYRWTGTELSE